MEKKLIEQLNRQSLWLRDSWLWLLHEKILDGGTKTALEVGCGAGHVMEILSAYLEVKGVDNDPGMVALCQKKGLDISLADGYKLPFENDSFDIVYCSFLLLWLGEPVKVLKEMSRVSKKWVICLAEPDYGARIDYPSAMEKLGQILVSDLQSRGADPFIGRKLRSIFSDAGLNAEIGVHHGVWPLEKAGKEILGELEWAEESVRGEMKIVVDEALKNGTLLQYNPVFWAVGRKE
ncbi:MAG: class I SAM-dependent methyltransferase [Thermoplasmata archaeon]|nr:class I SAM-dependent methyltransferase [Thermoplasmata archaeon]